MQISKSELQQMIRDGVKTVMEENGGGQDGGQGGAPGIVRNAGGDHAPPQRDKGVNGIMMVRALGAAKGDPHAAARMAQSKWGLGEDDPVVKSLTTGDNEGAAFLIPSGDAEELIELLRPRTVIRRMGPTTMPNPTGHLPINRQTGGATSEYIGESTAQNASQPSVGQVVATWKKLRTTVPISNELLMATGGDANNFVREDLLNSMAVREDQAFIRDDGGQFKPLGLRHWAPSNNVSASNGTSADNVELDFQELLNALEQSNVRMLRPGFLMSPREKNFLMHLRDANGNLIYPEIRNAQPTLYGYPVAWTTSIPTNLGSGNESEVYLVDFADAVIAETSDLMIEVSNEATYTDAGGSLVSAFDRDETVLKAIQRHDFVMRHDESIAVKTGVTWGA